MQSKLQLEAEDFYLLRRPLRSVQSLLDLNQDTRHDPELFADRVLGCFQDPVLQEAIYTASPELYAELRKSLDTAAPAAGKHAKLVTTLYKYLIRMSMRCTPYGLFAGCSSGQVTEKTAINFSEGRMRKQSRLDMNYVSELLQHLLHTTALQQELTYFPNNSLYQIGDSYRYIEYKLHNKKRKYAIASVKRSSYLDHLLQASPQGLPFRQLVDLVLHLEPSADHREAQDFVQELVDAQLLVSELEPTLTGDIFFEGLAERLEGKVPEETVRLVSEIQSLLETGGVRSFQEIHRIINGFFGKAGSKDLIQTDLFFEPEANQLSASVTTAVTAQLNSLFALSKKTVLTDLDKFKEDFYNRFEEREVPLLLALDSETGVGYGAAKSGRGDNLPLLEGISPTAKRGVGSTSWNAYTRLVHSIFKRSASSSSTVVTLTDEDLATVDVAKDLAGSVPASLYAFGSLQAASQEELDRGNFTFSLASCAGPSAANLLGRFCYGDEHLLQQTKAALQASEPDQDDMVYAEVVHLPEARVGNILMRPRLRQYEIPFLGASAVAPEDQIPVQDLLVSVRHGLITIRSKRLNKRVIPRLSTAHNFSTGLPIYKFLCDLQRDELYAGIHWSWENLSKEAFLPRVQYKNIILSKAQWNVLATDVQLPHRPGANDAALLEDYLQKAGVPRHVCLAEHDNELLLDLLHPASRDILMHQLRKKGKARLTEFLSSPSECFVTGGNGAAYANEILFPLSNKAAVLKGTGKRGVSPSSVTRSFSPGSEWLYFKLYGGTKSVEKVLTERVRPLLQRFVEDGLVSHWFFIRYTDPLHHIRLRLHLPPGQHHHMHQLLQQLHQAIAQDLEDGLLHRVQLDTYVRELERYGANNIEHSEQLFYYDSQAALNVFHMLEGDEGEEFRYLLAFRGLDVLLQDFGLDLDEKKRFLQRLAEMFFEEFNGDKSLQVQLNNRYRKLSRQLRSFLNPEEDDANGIAEATREFEIRSEQSRDVVAAIRELYPPDFVQDARSFSLLASYVHMFVNRFFVSKPRQHELALYNLLYKHYTAQVAMQEKNVPAF